MWPAGIVIVSLLIPIACPYRLIYDLPSRAAVELPDGMPPEEEVDEESNQEKPGFLTQFSSCIQPPQLCPNENITFWFYTRSTQNDPVQLDMASPESFQNIKPIPGKPWKLLIHGYTGWRDYAPNTEIRPAFFAHGEYNIISVDYGPIVRAPCYWAAAHNVPLISNCTAHVLDQLIADRAFSITDLHVVAFSLGCQVAGNLRHFLKAGPLKRITALDPAMPLFMSPNADRKLDESDAEFVDVIHTNAAWKGQLEATGHIDFYPNGGYQQPGCSPAEYGSVSSCNHARAVVYFAESISSETGFWAVPCSSIVTYTWGWCPADDTNQVLMGEYTPNTARGTYYLSTAEHSPFALGKQQEQNSSSLRRLSYRASN